jgi:hypothetical protein
MLQNLRRGAVISVVHTGVFLMTVLLDSRNVARKLRTFVYEDHADKKRGLKLVRNDQANVG